jgi:hypothetical protein
MTTKFNWWVEILDVTDDFILGIEDILGTIDHEDESGDATGMLHPGNGINYALLAVWIRGNPGGMSKTNIKVSYAARFFFLGNLINFLSIIFLFFFIYIFNMKLRQP